MRGSHQSKARAPARPKYQPKPDHYKPSRVIVNYSGMADLPDEARKCLVTLEKLATMGKGTLADSMWALPEDKLEEQKKLKKPTTINSPPLRPQAAAFAPINTKPQASTKVKSDNNGLGASRWALPEDKLEVQKKVKKPTIINSPPLRPQAAAFAPLNTKPQASTKVKSDNNGLSASRWALPEDKLEEQQKVKKSIAIKSPPLQPQAATFVPTNTKVQAAPAKVKSGSNGLSASRWALPEDNISQPKVENPIASRKTSLQTENPIAQQNSKEPLTAQREVVPKNDKLEPPSTSVSKTKPSDNGGLAASRWSSPEVSVTASKASTVVASSKEPLTTQTKIVPKNIKQEVQPTGVPKAKPTINGGLAASRWSSPEVSATASKTNTAVARSKEPLATQTEIVPTNKKQETSSTGISKVKPSGNDLVASRWASFGVNVNAFKAGTPAAGSKQPLQRRVNTIVPILTKPKPEIGHTRQGKPSDNGPAGSILTSPKLPNSDSPRASTRPATIVTKEQQPKTTPVPQSPDTKVTAENNILPHMRGIESKSELSKPTFDAPQAITKPSIAVQVKGSVGQTKLPGPVSLKTIDTKPLLPHLVGLELDVKLQRQVSQSANASPQLQQKKSVEQTKSRDPFPVKAITTKGLLPHLVGLELEAKPRIERQVSQPTKPSIPIHAKQSIEHTKQLDPVPAKAITAKELLPHLVGLELEVKPSIERQVSQLTNAPPQLQQKQSVEQTKQLDPMSVKANTNKPLLPHLTGLEPQIERRASHPIHRSVMDANISPSGSKVSTPFPKTKKVVEKVPPHMWGLEGIYSNTSIKEDERPKLTPTRPTRVNHSQSTKTDADFTPAATSPEGVNIFSGVASVQSDMPGVETTISEHTAAGYAIKSVGHNSKFEPYSPIVSIELQKKSVKESTQNNGKADTRRSGWDVPGLPHDPKIVGWEVVADVASKNIVPTADDPMAPAPGGYEYALEDHVSDAGVFNNPKEITRAIQGRPAAEEFLDWDGTWMPPVCDWEYDRTWFDNSSFVAKYIQEWRAHSPAGPSVAVDTSSENFFRHALPVCGAGFAEPIHHDLTIPDIENSINEYKRQHQTAAFSSHQMISNKMKPQGLSSLNFFETIEEEPAPVPEVNPFSPTTAVHLRPAIMQDAVGIASLYNHYVNNSFIPEDQEMLSDTDAQHMITMAKKDKLPFIVAIRGNQSAIVQTQAGAQSSRTAAWPVYEEVIGFASAESFNYGFAGGRKGRSRATVNMQAYVHPDHTRQGLGRNLLDHLIHVMNPGYAFRDACIWVNPENNPLYTFNNTAIFHQMMIQLPVLRSDDRAYPWVKEFLYSKFFFVEEARLKCVGRTSNVRGPPKWLDMVLFQAEATNGRDFTFED